MSAASRLAAAATCFVDEPTPTAGANIGLNSANVPGGISTVPIDEKFDYVGLDWHPTDAEPWAASIGYHLAVELSGAAADIDTGGAS